MADRYMLAIDGIIVNNSIPNFTVGLLMMFASYYIFGICYPRDADATLEFIQRYVCDFIIKGIVLCLHYLKSMFYM